MGLLDKLRKLTEGAAAQVNPFDGGRTFSDVVRPAQGGIPAPRMAAPRMAVTAPGLTPAQRDFPGRTNYGVPQDNMIDTPNGYITPEQYNRIMSPRPLMVSSSQQIQPFGIGYEDEYTPTHALQQPNAGFTGQTPLNSGFIQGSGQQLRRRF